MSIQKRIRGNTRLSFSKYVTWMREGTPWLSKYTILRTLLGLSKYILWMRERVRESTPWVFQTHYLEMGIQKENEKQRPPGLFLAHYLDERESTPGFSKYTILRWVFRKEEEAPSWPCLNTLSEWEWARVFPLGVANTLSWDLCLDKRKKKHSLELF